MLDKPSILAPAGNTDCFLAALAAGADAIYCGLKQFSARHAAVNFSLDELARLTRLAHQKGVQVYIPLNIMIKPDELDTVLKILDQLNRHVKPDALIIQDLAVSQLAAQTGFKGELHLSTLANVSFPAALEGLNRNFGISRVVVPRELSIDEIKAMAQACPDDLKLEVFVHGALCYAVSGRCYWSSFLGGKSGLRGRCVQPCRRVYSQKAPPKRLFACQDLSIDVLAKVLAGIDRIGAWKIEGRRKGPHYVYHTVSAYRLFRDEGQDPSAKKLALHLLEQALGRHGTHYRFLPQRPQLPVRPDIQTGSGKLIGKIQGPAKTPYLIPREEILKDDLLRIGYEDDDFHNTFKVPKHTPRRGRLYIKINPRQKAPSGTPVFLIDRRDKEFKQQLDRFRDELNRISPSSIKSSPISLPLPVSRRRSKNSWELSVYRTAPKINAAFGLWLPFETQDATSSGLSAKRFGKRPATCWLWLPPVVWPDTEAAVQQSLQQALKMGITHFVLNAPWQINLFPERKSLHLWIGPFCNIANPLAIQTLAQMGYRGVIVSPELGKTDYQTLGQQSTLPLGVVLSGVWPLCISRVASEDLQTAQPFASPKGEEAWITERNDNYWIYPNWRLDFNHQKEFFEKAGFQLFVHLQEPLPRSVKLKKRPGLWNLNHGLS